MNKKKIVHLISSLKIGGAESFLYDLIIGLGSTEHEHHVIFFHPGPHVARLQQAGIPTYQIKGLISLYDPLFIYRLWKTICTIKPDIIHSALWAANYVGRIIAFFQKIPIVCAVHLGVDLDGRIRNILDAATFKLATHVVAVSDDVAASIKKKHAWITASRITVIKNGIDCTAIVSRAHKYHIKRTDLGLSQDHCIIGSVGRFIPRKNYSFLIAAFAQLHAHNPLTRLVLVGTGPEEGSLRQKARDCGVEREVIFVVGQQAYGYFPLFDCFVLTSQREGLSIALLEAMSFGLPCVVTTHDQQHEVLVSEVNGYVVPSHDEKTLVTTLQMLIEDHEKRTEIGRRAREVLEKEFNLERVVDAYKNVFKEVINY